MTARIQKFRDLMKEKRVSQAELAERLNKGPRTISRWLSSPEGDNLKPEQVIQICYALGVNPKDIDPELQHHEAGKVQISGSVSVAAGNGYELMVRRYGVTKTDILELAPAMFAILAEGALNWPSEEIRRQEQLDAWAVKNGYMPNAVSEHLENLQRSAQQGKLFGEEHEYLPAENLFAEYFQSLAGSVENTSSHLRSQIGNCPGCSGFNFDKAAVETLTGGDADLTQSIENGQISLRDMLAELWAEDKAQNRIAYLRKEHEAAKAKREAEAAEWRAANPEQARELDDLKARIAERRGKANEND